jgi:hypothetical protein
LLKVYASLLRKKDVHFGRKVLAIMNVYVLLVMI